MHEDTGMLTVQEHTGDEFPYVVKAAFYSATNIRVGSLDKYSSGKMVC
jgi:hypothetical protein